MNKEPKNFEFEPSTHSTPKQISIALTYSIMFTDYNWCINSNAYKNWNISLRTSLVNIKALVIPTQKGSCRSQVFQYNFC